MVTLKTYFLAAALTGSAVKSPAQVTLPGGRRYMDTSWTAAIAFDSVRLYYYQVGAKYPESSEGLLAKARGYLEKKPPLNGSGYLTFRFVVDSLGVPQRRVEVLETDEQYHATVFGNETRQLLYGFLLTLKKWKPSPPIAGISRYYKAFFTFKVHEGTLVNIIP